MPLTPSDGAAGGRPAPEPGAALWPLFAALICAGVVLVYLSSAKAGFFSDDRLLLAQAGGIPFSARALLQPFNDQVQPFFRAFFRLEYFLFGLNAGPYHYASLFLHALNTLLVMTLAAKLGGRGTGLLAGVLFGFSYGHAQAVTWITCQGQLLAVAWLLCALHFFLVYLGTRRKRYLFLSAGAHLLMLGSFGYGLELPAVLAFMHFTAGRRPAAAGRGPWTPGACLAAVTPHLANCALFLGAHLAQTEKAASLFGGGPALFTSVPQALLREAAAVVLRIFYPLFMAFPPAGSFFYKAAYIAVMLALTVSALDLGDEGFKARRPDLLAFGTLAALLYFWPAIGRPGLDLPKFVSTSRYAYAPGAAMAVVFALALPYLKFFTRESVFYRRARAGAAVFAALVLVTNCLLINERTERRLLRNSDKTAPTPRDLGILGY